ncbi:hypothetical protein Tco_0796331 [Tanacetum coccineum]
MFLIKMPPRKNRTLNEMDLLMNRRGNHNIRGIDDEQSENPFGEDDDSMKVNIPDFVGDTLSPEGFIDWLVVVEEVFEFKEVPENKRVSLIATKLRETEDQRVSRYIGGLRVRIMDSVNMFNPMTLCALAFEKQNRRVGSSSSPAIIGASSSGNVASCFAPSQAKSESKKASKRHLLADPEGDDDAAYEEYEEAPIYDEEPECEKEYVSGDVGVNLVVRHSRLTSKANGDDWLKHNIFQSTYTILGKVCTFVCDSGSCDNLIAAEAVQKLGLKTQNYPKPYKLQWLKKGGECDVVPMDACRLFLDRPWEYDRDITHNGRTNTYSFLFGGVKITLMPNKPKEVISKPTGTLLTLSQFEDELEMGDDVFVLIGKEVAEDSEIPEAMIPLLEEFSNVFLDELPDGLPPLRDIQHHIDLEPGSQLPNRQHYRMSLREHEELRRQVEELVSKGHVRESMSPCAIPALLTPKKDGTWRMCVDSRAINKITVRYMFPIPRLDDFLDQISGATIFTKLDLKSGYYQIHLRPRDNERPLSRLVKGCMSGCDMSNSDELRHTDNTTLVPPRLPDTLPQVYHKRRPTLGLLILPFVPLFSLTIRRTARISALPIEPNLAKRARISTINLDDYQLDPFTPPPSPSSPFSMATYQWMIAETDPTQRKEALTAYGMKTGQNLVPVPETALTVCITRLRGQLHTILEYMDHYPNACLEELEAFMTLWVVKPRVEESSLVTLSVDELITQLRQMCEDAEDRASNAQEEARQKRKEALEEVVQQIYQSQFGISNVTEGDKVKFASSTLLDGALTWWNVYVRSVTLDTLMQHLGVISRLCLSGSTALEMKSSKWKMNCLPLNIKGNVTSSKPVDLHEVIEMAHRLMYQVVQELGEIFGDKRKWNGNHYNNNNPNTTSNLNPNKRPETARVFTTRQEGQDIRPKTAELHLALQTKEDLKAKEDREVMLLVFGVAKKDITRTSARTVGVKVVETKFEATNKILRTIRGRIKETLREITKHQPALKEDAEHLAEYIAYVLKLR